MKSKIIATATILAALGCLHSHPALSQPATDGGRQPGFWQPQAQIDTARNITLRLLNETGLKLEYGNQVLACHPWPSEPAKTSLLASATAPPILQNIPINVQGGTTTLKYDYSVDAKQNLVTIRITRSDGRTRQDRSVYIDEKGRIYSF